MRVVCPKCGMEGYLYYNRKLGFYVKHGSKRTCTGIPSDKALEVVFEFDDRIALIRYMGGDFFLLTYLKNMVPPHFCYVEVFGGGAPLLLNKSPSPVEVYNDIDDNLVTLFRVVRDRYEEFIKKFDWLLASRRDYYDYLKKIASNDFKDDLERALAYFYVLRFAYAATLFRGLSFGPRKNNARDFWSAVKKLRLIHERLKNVYIESLDFREVIKKYDTPMTFFYCDPPHLYIGTEKGQGYYAHNFTDKDYMDLLTMLERIKGKFLLKQACYTPFVMNWAKQHGYCVRSVSLKMAAKANPRAEKTDTYNVYFIANYKI